MESLLNFIGPYIWLLPVPFIIFSVTPRMSRWAKTGRIIFLWAISAFVACLGLYWNLTNQHETYVCCIPKAQYYFNEVLSALWTVFLINIYIGVWEFLWRCVYRQWSWPPLNNIQYGIASNISILGAAMFILGLPSLYAFVMLMGWIHL